MAISVENVLDKISELLIVKFATLGIDLTAAQKTIRGGEVVVGRNDTEKLVLYQYDKIANAEDAELDVISEIATTVPDIDILNEAQLLTQPYTYTFYIQSLYGHGPFDENGKVDISEIVNNPDNPINVGQFITFSKDIVEIDPDKAKHILDTNIFELIAPQTDVQEKINKFFSDWNSLKGNIPSFNFDIDDDTIPDTWTDDVEDEQDTYSDNHDISNDGGYITRLNRHANNKNSGKTLESLYRELSLYLTDVTKEKRFLAEDSRPEYESKSDGYLKIRHLNQGIIIRRQESDNVGIEDTVTTAVGTGPSYLMDGFTISMWVKFLDRTNTGTLFNYGNPTRNMDPKGFKLETFVINGDETLETDAGITWKTKAAAATDQGLFANNDYERFIRLVVYDHIAIGGKLYDSHLGMTGFNRANYVPEFGLSSSNTTVYQVGYEAHLLTHTRVPIDFNEWYFIVASYDPSTNDSGAQVATYLNDTYYWLGNKDDSDGAYTNHSGYGAKCKVEIISKSDLLRARGYKV